MMEHGEWIWPTMGISVRVCDMLLITSFLWANHRTKLTRFHSYAKLSLLKHLNHWYLYGIYIYGVYIYIYTWYIYIYTWYIYIYMVYIYIHIHGVCVYIYIHGVYIYMVYIYMYMVYIYIHGIYIKFCHTGCSSCRFPRVANVTQLEDSNITGVVYLLES